MKFVNKKTIEIDRELSDLDKFTFDFIKVLEKYTNYVLVSGYVSILLGRSRSSEDVGIIIPKISFSTFQSFYIDLIYSCFICLNVDDDKSVYSYLKNQTAVRFAEEGKVIPNIEFKWVKNKFEDIALNNPISVKLSKGDLKISPLELQIAFKQEVLKSPKDLEDARHLEKIADSYLDNKLIKEYRESLREFYK